MPNWCRNGVKHISGKSLGTEDKINFGVDYSINQLYNIPIILYRGKKWKKTIF